MHMEILEDIVGQLSGALMSLLGLEDERALAGIIAIVLVVLLLAVVVLAVLLVRSRKRAKRCATQIDELESQVLGLQALTQLSGGVLSEDGDSIVYRSPGVSQQIQYDDFPEDVSPEVKRPEDDETLVDEIEERLDALKGSLHAHVFSGGSAHDEPVHDEPAKAEPVLDQPATQRPPARKPDAAARPAAPAAPSGIAGGEAAGRKADDAARDAKAADARRVPPAMSRAKAAEQTLRPLSAEQIRMAHDEGASSGHHSISGASPDAEAGQHEPDRRASAADARLDTEVDAILDMIKRKNARKDEGEHM